MSCFARWLRRSRARKEQTRAIDATEYGSREGRTFLEFHFKVLTETGGIKGGELYYLVSFQLVFLSILCGVAHFTALDQKPRPDLLTIGFLTAP